MTESPAIFIRPAREEDIPSILLLWQEMIDGHSRRDPRFNLAEKAPAIFRGQALEAIKLDDHAILVAEAGDNIVGYCLASINDNIPIFEIDRYGFIADLTVKQEYRCQGIGRLLWREMKSWLQQQNVQAIQLNVSELNPDGLLFWKECGFRDFIRTLWCDLESNH